MHPDLAQCLAGERLAGSGQAFSPDPDPGHTLKHAVPVAGCRLTEEGHGGVPGHRRGRSASRQSPLAARATQTDSQATGEAATADSGVTTRSSWLIRAAGRVGRRSSPCDGSGTRRESPGHLRELFGPPLCRLIRTPGTRQDERTAREGTPTIVRLSGFQAGDPDLQDLLAERRLVFPVDPAIETRCRCAPAFDRRRRRTGRDVGREV
jgi:hypothetical protein